MPQPEVVTHKVKSVRKHFIKLRVPHPPPADAESFVIETQSATLDLSPADFLQFINCLMASRDAIMGAHTFEPPGEERTGG